MDNQAKIDWEKLRAFLAQPETACRNIMNYALTSDMGILHHQYIDPRVPHKKFSSKIMDLFFEATENDQMDIVSCLLENKNININIQKADTLETALHRAFIQKHIGVASVLMQAGADREMMDQTGRTVQSYRDEIYLPHSLMQLNELCPYLTEDDFSAAVLQKEIEKRYFIKPYLYKKSKSNFDSGWRKHTVKNEFLHAEGKSKHFFNDVFIASLEQKQHHLTDYLLRSKMIDPKYVIDSYTVKMDPGFVGGGADQTMAHIAVLNNNMIGLALLQKYGYLSDMKDGNKLSVYQTAKKIDKFIKKTYLKKSSNLWTYLYQNLELPDYAERVERILRRETTQITVANGQELDIEWFEKNDIENIKQIRARSPEEIKNEWKSLNDKMAASSDMNKIAFLSAVAQLRDEDTLNPNLSELPLFNRTALMAAENGYSHILNYMFRNQMGDFDFLSETTLNASYENKKGMGVVRYQTKNPFILSKLRDEERSR